MWGLRVLIPLLGAVGALRVSQDPEEMRVMAGDEVALGCEVLVAEPWDMLRLEWVKDVGYKVLCAARLSPTTLTSLAPCTPGFHLAWHPPRATLSLSQARGDDTGRYLCQVTLEIPRHDMATGNGTQLSVSTAADGGRRVGLVWGLVGALGGTALLVGLAILSHWCWRRNSDAIIYMNVMAPSVRAPKKLLPPLTVMESNPYQGGLQRARAPPVTPQP
ncbi:transmembrane and immunoglobulin domain-containing protein 2 [Athene noctua]|uniref:transmembrane and immunoglobulin domain-containing protein 2 n=1 Tax=Athene noctua TaxID=126797 RepID=UPI003EBB27CA